MKLIYCIHSIYNPGGMERVLLNKITYLVNHTDWDITIVTTDQKNKPSFYPLPERVRLVDLDINYSDDNRKNVLKKIGGYLKRKRLHKQRLAELLQKEKADIVISLYPSESSFIPTIKDNSKKVLELHFCKFFRLQYGRKGILGLIDRLRTWQDEWIVKRFDRFVILTNEDKGYWGNITNIQVITNAVKLPEIRFSNVESHRLIAVGRLDYQKGFDRLIEAWRIVCNHKSFDSWSLDIFGQGEWKDMLEAKIEHEGLTGRIHINPPTKNILKEYVESSALVMSSNYEGLSMVMIEAMSCGLPVVSFDCKCGPKDVIESGKNGYLVKNGDIQGLAEAMMKVMGDEELRKRMSEEAKKVTETYSEEKVMKQWMDLFERLTKK
ncbi:MAG: glycosyltransferase family 4 protein [Bacteroidaceae bacterium]|nr:glycosyltransferase family 4 protein [Bacteroidaceae bacterium]